MKRTPALLVTFLSLAVTRAALADSTIWDAAAVPSRVDAGGDGAVELGVKFCSEVDGFVNGVRLALVNSKWPSDIQRQTEQIEILKGLLGGGQ